MRKKPAAPKTGAAGTDCQRSLAEFAPAGAKEVKIIFSGGVYVGENTLRAASVESSAAGGRLRRRAQRSLFKRKPNEVGFV